VQKQQVLHISVGARARACACARVVLLIQLATRRQTVICGPSGSTTIFDIISQMARFSGKSFGHKMSILIVSTTFI
jgi:hypothetical protein